MDDARKLAIVLILIGIGVGFVGQILVADAHLTVQSIIGWIITAVGGIVLISGGWMFTQQREQPKG